MGESVYFLEHLMNDEYMRYVRGHNDAVRSVLKAKFDKEIYAHLRKIGLTKFKKYNDIYRKDYGGKSFQNTTVVDPHHEWHDEYILRKKKNIHACISQLLVSSVGNPADILEYYMTLFSHEEIIDTIRDMEMSEGKKKVILENIESIKEKFKKLKE